ncbi:hypothetical protein LY78DRAFT_749400 [Colletotrichum sublineola]|nr:hypothetical protein LY78DRAFT_749400 [Colletotrichum sublineola]
MATIEHLPNELLVAIAKSVRDVRGLASMAKMNRRFNSIATLPLYREAVRRQMNDALFYCAGEGLLGALELLRAAGQDLDVRQISESDEERTRKTFMAAWELEEFDLKAAFQKAYRRTQEGAIHRAVLKGQTEAVRWLISHGVPVDSVSANLCECDDAEDSGTRSPLHLALCRGQEEVAHILLANGAKIDEFKPFSNTTAWQSAIQSRHPATAMEFALSLAATHSEMFARHADGLDIDSEHDGHSVTEQDILSSVTALLDPIACLEAYAESKKSEAVLGQKRILEHPMMHGQLPLRNRGAKEPKIHLSPPLRPDTPIKLAYGASINTSDIIGKTFSDTVNDSGGRNVRFLEASLAQYIANSPRVATPV